MTADLRPASIHPLARRLEPVVCILVGIAVALAKGPDASFDLRNYHWYNVWALLTDRLHDDLLVASLQTYFNPLLDVPYYLLARHGGLSLATAWAGVLFGVFMALVLRIARIVLQAIPSIAGNAVAIWVLSILATVLSVSSVATASEIGTTMNDINVGVLVLAALLLLVTCSDGKMPFWRPLVAGLLLGAAAGLKLTTAIYAPALVVALAAMMPNRQGLKAIAILCIAWGAGLLVTQGWWSVLMWQRFASPAPPLYNALVKSPWFPAVPFLDLRFSAKDIWGVLTYPADWAFRRSTLVAELPLRDPRMLFGLLSALVVLVVLRTRPIRFVAVFALVAYVVWVLQFGILRYAVEIEAVCGILIVAAVVAATGRLRRGVVSVVATSVVLVLALRVTGYIDWGRMPQGSETFVTSGPVADDGSLIVVVGGPLGIYAPFVGGRDLRFVGVNFVTEASRQQLAGRQVATLIDTYGAAGRIYVLLGEPESQSQDLQGWKLQPVEGSCRRFEGPLIQSEPGRSVMLCRAALAG